MSSTICLKHTDLAVMPSVLQRWHYVLRCDTILCQCAGIVSHRSHCLSPFSPHLGVIDILYIIKNQFENTQNKSRTL